MSEHISEARCDCPECRERRLLEATAAYSMSVEDTDPARLGEQCKRCGENNPSWSAPSPLWNAVMRGGSIVGDPLYDDLVCATCFMILAEEQVAASLWRVTAERVNVPLETITPSGRIWDDKRFLWLEPGAEGSMSEQNVQVTQALEPEMIDADLKPCPFCGEADVWILRMPAHSHSICALPDSPEAFWIEHPGDCGVGFGADNLEELIAAWNHRTRAEPDLVEVLRELEGKARLGGDALGNSSAEFESCQRAFYMLAEIARAALSRADGEGDA